MAFLPLLGLSCGLRRQISPHRRRPQRSPHPRRHPRRRLLALLLLALARLALALLMALALAQATVAQAEFHWLPGHWLRPCLPSRRRQPMPPTHRRKSMKLSLCSKCSAGLPAPFALQLIVAFALRVRIFRIRTDAPGVTTGGSTVSLRLCHWLSQPLAFGAQWLCPRILTLASSALARFGLDSCIRVLASFWPWLAITPCLCQPP